MKRLKYFKVVKGVIRSDEVLAGKHLVHATIAWSKESDEVIYSIHNDQDKLVGYGIDITLSGAKKQVKRRMIELGVVFYPEKRRKKDE